jgi:hypothetical protein
MNNSTAKVLHVGTSPKYSNISLYRNRPKATVQDSSRECLQSYSALTGTDTELLYSIHVNISKAIALYTETVPQLHVYTVLYVYV